MSQMRDARLARALDEAPDAGQRPPSPVRQAVLEAAHRAVARPAASAPWWRAWRLAPARSPMPWSAAFATFAVATLVTVLWHDREIPGAKVDSPAPRPLQKQEQQAQPEQRPQQQQPVGSQSSARDAMVPQQAPGATPAPEKARPAAPVPGPAAVLQERSRPAESRASVPPAEPVPSTADLNRAEPLRDQAAAALAKSQAEAAASRGRAQRNPSRESASEAPQAPGATAAGTAAAPASPPPMVSAAPALSARMSALPELEWTQAMIVAGPRSIELGRAQAPALDELLRVTARRERSDEPLQQPVSARVELRRAGELVATVELAGPQLRWTVPRAGGAVETFSTRPAAAQLLSLREEIERLLGR